jgi:hypothetical protein
MFFLGFLVYILKRMIAVKAAQNERKDLIVIIAVAKGPKDQACLLCSCAQYIEKTSRVWLLLLFFSKMTALSFWGS